MTSKRQPHRRSLSLGKLDAERLKRLRPDAEKATNSSLLADVKLFEKASLAGEYYESFGVNSRNKPRLVETKKSIIEVGMDVGYSRMK